MKPILYAADATAFTSNGLGRLADAITCEVEEERNGQYELVMEYPVSGLHFSDIAHSTYIKAVPADGKDPQPFRVYNISKPINGKCTIKAEHISYRLSDIPTEPFEATSVAASLEGLRTHAVETCPFTFWTDKSTTGNFKVEAPASIRSLLGGVEGSILDVFGGGEYEFDNYTVRLWQNRGANNGVTLRYGKNITDLTQEEAIDNTYTGVMPFWRSSDGNTTVTLPEKVIYSSNAGNFPYHKTKVVDFSESWQTQPTEAQLRTRTQRYIQNNSIGIPKVSIKVKFLPLWQSEEYKDIANLERVNLCDTITVKFPALGVSATAKVVKTRYDVLAERYIEIEVGDARTGFAKAVKSDVAEVKSTSKTFQSFLASELAEATGKITGATDGYIKQIFNAAGNWSELVAMNTNDPATATKVWRMNYEGIGGGTSFNGPFTITMTLDGKINASQITTGILNADLIRAGTLADTGGNFSLVLATGALTMKKGSININNGAFQVTTAGKLTCTGADISGDIFSGSKDAGKPWVHVDSGRIKGGYGSSQFGYIEYSASTRDISTGTVYSGIQLQGGMIRISASRMAVAASSDVNTQARWCITGTFTVISRIRDNGGGSITYWQRDLQFINGLLVDVGAEY